MFLSLPEFFRPVHKQDAVQMVDLMLEDARQPAFGFDSHRMPMTVQSFYRHYFQALHLPLDARDGKAALGTEHCNVGGTRNLGVYQDIKFGRSLFIFLITEFNDDQPGRFTHLRGSQSHAGSLAHGLNHIVHQGLEVGTEIAHFTSLMPQDDLRKGDNFSNSHGGYFTRIWSTLGRFFSSRPVTP